MDEWINLRHKRWHSMTANSKDVVDVIFAVAGEDILTELKF